jgi:hypothetical protein
MATELGHHFAVALGGKRGWLGSELLRLKREGTDEVQRGHPNGMEVDTPMA